MEPPDPGIPQKSVPPGRYMTNFAFICAALALFASPGLFGIIGVFLAGRAIAKGDRRLGPYALVAVIVCAAVPILVNLATTSPPAPGP